MLTFNYDAYGIINFFLLQDQYFFIYETLQEVDSN